MLALFCNLLWRHYYYIHGPIPSREQSINLHKSINWLILRFHLHKQVDVAIFAVIASRAAAKENHSLRMNGIDDLARNRFDQRIVNRWAFANCDGTLIIFRIRHGT